MVFPTSVGFPRYIGCRLIVSVFCVFRAYILHSVVAERISESNLYILFFVVVCVVSSFPFRVLFD